MPVHRPTLGIVIPALDEARELRSHLPTALEVADEVVVSDGGSVDGTPEVATLLGAEVVSGPPGRGRQLNRGAAACSSQLLVFLHADTRLPAAAPERIRAALEAGAVGGAFLLRFDQRRPLLRVAERLINLRTRWTHLPLGDQAHFVARATFDRLDGYRPWPILEDLDFAWRLRRLGPLAILSPPVVTAARRYVEGGVLRTAATNWLIWSLYFAGVSPHRLARLYRQVR